MTRAHWPRAAHPPGRRPARSPRLGQDRVGGSPRRHGRGRGRDVAAAEHPLISLLALNGLRVSEATGADIEALGIERGHRTLVITRKGGKVVTIPLAPRTASAAGLAIGERCEGPVFLAPGGGRLDHHGAGRIVRRVARRAGISKQVGPQQSDGSASSSASRRLGWRVEAADQGLDDRREPAPVRRVNGHLY